MLHWPRAPSDPDTVIHNEQATRIPVIVSLLGRFWQPAKRRLSRYKYNMYIHIRRGGDLRCASLRDNVALAVTGCPVLSVNHLYGLFPTTDTWGYYRSDISCVFGKWLDTVRVAMLHGWGRAVASARPCRTVRRHGGFRLQTATAWLALRTCFHARFNDPRESPSTCTTDMLDDAGAGLTNVVLWDLAFLALAPQASLNSTTTSISARLWAYLASYADPGGLSRWGFPRLQPATHQARARHVDGPGQRLTIWYSAQPFTEAYALRPYSLPRILRGCKVFSSRESPAVRIQQNPTGLPPPHRRAATALGSWVLTDGGAARRGYRAERAEEPRSPRGRPGSFSSAADGGTARGRACAVYGPLLPMQLARGEVVSYIACKAMPLRGSAGLR